MVKSPIETTRVCLDSSVCEFVAFSSEHPSTAVAMASQADVGGPGSPSKFIDDALAHYCRRGTERSSFVRLLIDQREKVPLLCAYHGDGLTPLSATLRSGHLELEGCKSIFLWGGESHAVDQVPVFLLLVARSSVLYSVERMRY
jgi:hypothetical protein